MMRIIEHRPWQAIGFIVFLLSPALFSVPHLRISGDRFALLPMDMPAMKAMYHIEKFFPVGSLDPFAIVISAPSDMANLQLRREVQNAVHGIADEDIVSAAKRLGLNHEEALSFKAALHD